MEKNSNSSFRNKDPKTFLRDDPAFWNLLEKINDISSSNIDSNAEILSILNAFYKFRKEMPETLFDSKIIARTELVEKEKTMNEISNHRYASLIKIERKSYYKANIWKIFEYELSKGINLAYRRTILLFDKKKKLGGRKGSREDIHQHLIKYQIFSNEWYEECKKIEQKYSKRTVYDNLKKIFF